MTKADALSRYASAYRAWLRGQLYEADFRAAEVRAKVCGASPDELRDAIAPKEKQVQR